MAVLLNGGIIALGVDVLGQGTAQGLQNGGRLGLQHVDRGQNTRLGLLDAQPWIHLVHVLAPLPVIPSFPIPATAA
jgi:hypothetical protein